MSVSPILSVDARMIRTSGIGTVIRNVLQHAMPLLPGWQLRLVGNPEQIAQEGFGNAELIACDAPIYSLAEQRAMPQALGQADLVWIPHYNIPLMCQRPMVVTVHDVCHLAWPDYRKSLPKRLYSQLLLKGVAEKAKKVVCDSHFTMDEVARLTSIPADKTQVIHCGVDPIWFEAKAEPTPVPTMLYVGNIKPHKNLRSLLNAFAQVVNDIPHQLLLVGRKEGFIHGDAEVERMATQLGDRVQFTGYVSDEALRVITASADFLVMPSLYEGFGLPPLEAMAAGVPVLCSDAASLPEVCGDAALMVNAGSVDALAHALTHMAGDETLKTSLATKGKAQAKTFTWEKAGKAYAEIFQAAAA